jgi:anaerobic magnesium-protoporphyrin IX monomethyl ester cyclase
MKITLISPYTDITNFGLRTLSSVLRKSGYKTQMIFLPDPFGDDRLQGHDRYNKKVMTELIHLCSGSDIIGLTLMTDFFDNAVQITSEIKKSLDIPVIWGGVHPTICPEESLEYADMICVGEGEETLLTLIKKMDNKDNYLSIDNLWIKFENRVIKNPLGKLTPSLDRYPIPDYSLQDHYVLYKEKIVPMDDNLLRLFLQKGTVSTFLKKIGYQTMTGRGCPHRCTYCINDTLKSLYEGQSFFRWRSVEHVMLELSWVKENMPYIEYIWISDDTFFARSFKDLEFFCKEYKDKIGLPFICLASPLTITENKMELLVDSGLIYLQMGLQSGSKRIQELFNRGNMSNEVMMKAIRIINRYKDKMIPPTYDFIVDVPYETDSDKIESLRFITNIPKPFRLQPFSLVIYPGTTLYKIAKEDEHLKDDKQEIYSKRVSRREPSYLNLLMTLAKGGKFPTLLLKILVNQRVLRILNSNFLKPFFRKFYSIGKSLVSLTRKNPIILGLFFQSRQIL